MLTDLETSPKGEVERKLRPTAIHIEPKYTTIRGACALTGLGATSIWMGINSGDIRILRVGSRGKRAGRTLLEISTIHAWLAKRAAAREG
jgi:hypothetical protein